MEVVLKNGKPIVDLRKREQQTLRDANELVFLLAGYGDEDGINITRRLNSIVRNHCPEFPQPAAAVSGQEGK